MRFRLTLHSDQTPVKIPINYQYPLSAAIYKILNRSDEEYAAFLHAKGYGKGFKLFTFSQLNCPFKIDRDRLILLADKSNFIITFHLPDAAENFIKGLFQTEKIDIADKFSKGTFTIVTVESLPVRLPGKSENEIISVDLAPISPLVAGLPDERGIDEYLTPDDKRFTEVIIYNWREKIKTCYGEQAGEEAVLLAAISFFNRAPKSRLIAIKANTKEQTKIRGWMNFVLNITAEKRFVGLLLNAGAGINNAQGMGCVVVRE